MIFRAIWPIADERINYRRLIRDAKEDLPLLTARAHARIVAQGRFSIAEAIDVPGSGRVTETVLVYEAPAEPIPTRSYWKAIA